MAQEKKGIIEMLICAMLWSIAGIFIKFIPWNGFAIASMRSLIAGITMLIYIFASGRKIIINKKVIVSGVLTSCGYICFVVSNKLTTAANAIVLQFTSPVFIVVLSAILFKRKISRADMITVICTMIGITLFFIDQMSGGTMLGNFIAILSGLLMASMFITVGNLPGDERFSAALMGQTFTFLVGLPFVIATRPELSLVPVLSILTLGIFQLGISYVLYIKASMTCPPLACCLLAAVEPMLNPVWVAIFDGERPGRFALVGCIIVVFSVTIWCALSKESDKKADA